MKNVLDSLLENVALVKSASLGNVAAERVISLGNVAAENHDLIVQFINRWGINHQNSQLTLIHLVVLHNAS